MEARIQAESDMLTLDDDNTTAMSDADDTNLNDHDSQD